VHWQCCTHTQRESAAPENCIIHSVAAFVRWSCSASSSLFNVVDRLFALPDALTYFSSRGKKCLSRQSRSRLRSCSLLLRMPKPQAKCELVGSINTNLVRIHIVEPAECQEESDVWGQRHPQNRISRRSSKIRRGHRLANRGLQASARATGPQESCGRNSKYRRRLRFVATVESNPSSRGAQESRQLGARHDSASRRHFAIDDRRTLS